MISLSRRSVLALGGAMLGGIGAGGRSAVAGTDAPVIRATTRILEIGGRPARVLGLLQPDGTAGMTLEPGMRFRAALTNGLDEPTIIHWHGQIPPVEQDGVGDMPAPMLRPGETRRYDFAADPGTHWMHAHVPDQEMRLLAAPLIVRSAEDLRADRQEVTLLLHDFSFTPLAEHLARLNAAPADPHAGHAGHGAPAGGATAAAAMDLNDIDFDAYLANDRTLSDPQVVRVERGGRVLLRIINGASATVFRIDTGGLSARILAVDGQPVLPIAAQRFALAMGQRADLLVEIPAGGGAFPMLALREGATERTGIVLATAGAEIRRIAPLGEANAAPYASAQEAALRAALPLASRPPQRRFDVALTGTMAPYAWTIDGRAWGRHRPLQARSGERIEIALTNRSGMAHPMHLHGHRFQVVEAGGRRIAGAVRDTVQVPANERLVLALDAGQPGRWMFHCHHMPHLATGMMTEFVVEG
ncbi:copper oxidase [Falsiroseomonas bella]|uniref:Copper oxidase n=1 Tax=Falsiroseomonas bella TaxID=2184016 RepID=A0A317F5F4_9PROT|nr:multicopper oxidase family protein [Falsiroseomonas bella]PWS34370.1 copper oxidase [Falsiroseomonas bella]